MNNFCITSKLDFDFYESIDEVIDSFVKWWYSLVTKLEVGDKIQTNIDNSFNNLVILGFCKMNYAYEFLTQDLSYWVFMPCMVSIYQKDDWVFISAWLPKWIFAWVELDENLKNLSSKIDEEIINIIKTIWNV